MDRFWLEKAHKYISEHNAFTDVSDISIDDVDSVATISATVIVNLPSRFIKSGTTEIGVKNKEEVHFCFDNSFPLKAPAIQLRDDFPRCFPHINPSDKKVIPCIYAGTPSELLQQNGWMNEILNQLVDWLEKAASNALMNYDQGWEPMRNDNPVGFMQYDIDKVLSSYDELKTSSLISVIHYEILNIFIFASSLYNPGKAQKAQKAHVIYLHTNNIINNYVPNTIRTLSELYEYARLIGIDNIKELIEKVDLENINEDKIFIVFSIRRPAKLIGSEHNTEFLNFVISKQKHRVKNRKELKRTLPDCSVGMLYHVAEESPRLLRRISGVQTKIDEDKTIALVGCGSLGSKIGLHLARNGNGPFLCVDNDIFMPHNNARHALTSRWGRNKADLLSSSISSIGKILTTSIKEDALDADYSKSRMIIDTTASFTVRHFLMGNAGLPPIISCGLYGRGQSGLMITENGNKTSSLVNIWSHLYHKTLKDDDIHAILFTSSLENIAIGQSCRSQTMIVDDTRISLMAAAMSLKAQHILEVGFPKNAEILFSQYDDNYSLKTIVYPVPEFIPIKSLREKEWAVFISAPIIERMRSIMNHKSPNETGGALLGSVFLYSKSIVITDIIDAPPDSIETPSLFILGVEGLERKIKNTEKRTNGKVTYLGTWHSHPQGGSASQTDKETFSKLLFVRNYEPTVCLIITKNEVMIV